MSEVSPLTGNETLTETTRKPELDNAATEETVPLHVPNDNITSTETGATTGKWLLI